MSEEQQTTEQQLSEVEREERRLERLRLISAAAAPVRYEDEDDTPPRAA
jgi:hypothetical protein